MDNARPITSNPGPMLADEQGVLITKEVAAIVGEGGRRRDQEKKRNKSELKRDEASSDLLGLVRSMDGKCTFVASHQRSSDR